ncbi:saccharopine dehydrogenase NADP-binding domain-containing protein [Streptomyces sulphureus]|uniref:saccharopine dehydrogenase NADP-binding domain-containing protein n=1 Tax=Streptomyces sulphureus TaxID=47758 RepID=UPI00037098E8|nr:saccharopine dehydrogenase NADP-binding domain-containing protein [Streptomyces sulphureus]
MIAVLGGYGAAGGQAARLLVGWGLGPLRVGGRNLASAQRFVSGELPPGSAEPAEVDLEDSASLAGFLRGCDLLVNCAGPSVRTSQRVAFASLLSGCHIVDAGAGELEAVRPAVGGRTVLCSAGALPGMTGLLPRHLAGHFDSVHGLTSYAGVLDRFTATGAEDYLAGVFGAGNAPLAAWRYGAARPGALRRRSDIRLPFFPRPMTACPYLDNEAAAVARALSLTRGTWYSVVDGAHLLGALDAAPTLSTSDAVAALCRATGLDAAGRRPYVTLLLQLDGVTRDGPGTRTAVLSAPGISALTGGVAAAAARAVTEGVAPTGLHQAADALDPSTVLEYLLKEPEVCRLTVHDASVDELTTAEDGTL